MNRTLELELDRTEQVVFIDKHKNKGGSEVVVAFSLSQLVERSC